MKDIVYSPEKAAEEHVWQYEHEVLEAEDELTIKVADGTQIVAADGKLAGAGQSVTLPAGAARAHIAAGRVQPAAKRKA